MKKRKSKPVPGVPAPFPQRVVLGVGYPWANGTGKKGNPYDLLAMRDAPVCGRNKPLRFPKILWRKELPQYRLVLEITQAGGTLVEKGAK